MAERNGGAAKALLGQVPGETEKNPWSMSSRHLNLTEVDDECISRYGCGY